jgi:glycoside/pentoside/hexuronide:cation symporter, GPH family
MERPMTSAPASGSPNGLPLASRTIFWFALPQIPHGFAILPVINYVPAFYSDHFGLPLAMVGLMLVLSRITDVITDPILGVMSDSFRSKFGRRKPFIVVGLPMMILATWFVFVPPDVPTLDYLFWGLFFMYLGFTIVDIPYAAWGAELSSNYDERSKVAATRGAFGSVGSLLTLSIPVIMQALGYTDIAKIMMVMALAFLVTQPLFFAFALWKVPERPATELADGSAATRGFKLAALLANRPLVQLLCAIVLLISGMAIGATLNMIVFTHVAQGAHLFAGAVFVQNVVAIAAVPVWLMIARRLGKHRAAAIAVSIIACASAATFLVGPGDGYLLSGLVILVGVGMGAVMFLFSAMIADLVDRDLLNTGEERTGLYFAAGGMAGKLAGVFGVLIGTAIPGLAGFQPSDATHSPDSLLVLRAVYAFVSPILAIPAMYLLWTYPLDRAAQADLRRQIEARRQVLQP